MDISREPVLAVPFSKETSCPGEHLVFRSKSVSNRETGRDEGLSPRPFFVPGMQTARTDPVNAYRVRAIIALSMIATLGLACRKPASGLEQAQRTARAERKVLMVQFGADWCPDCLVLSAYLQQPSLH